MESAQNAPKTTFSGKTTFVAAEVSVACVALASNLVWLQFPQQFITSRPVWRPRIARSPPQMSLRVHSDRLIPVNMKHSSDAGLMFGKRRRWWTNIKPALGRFVMFASLLRSRATLKFTILLYFTWFGSGRFDASGNVYFSVNCRLHVLLAIVVRCLLVYKENNIPSKIICPYRMVSYQSK